MKPDHSVPYAAAGVDTGRAESALKLLANRIRGTWPRQGVGRVKLDVGKFANVIDIGGIGLAITTDGVGSKVLIAQQMNDYRTVGIDCVAMNVNDLLCVGASPLSMVDYLAVQAVDGEIVEEIAEGLCEGARQAGISIVGGETAQLGEMITGEVAGKGFDLAGAAIGLVPLDRIIVGQDVEDGDLVIAIESSGIHSNGLTLARRVLLEQAGLGVRDYLPELGRALGEELLAPTAIYVPEVLQLLRGGVGVKALAHITGDGLLNLLRTERACGFVLERLPPRPSIFSVIQERGAISDAEMFRVFNMGVGFCLVVSPTGADRATSTIESFGKRAHVIGRADTHIGRRIVVESVGLVGEGGAFRPNQ